MIDVKVKIQKKKERNFKKANNLSYQKIEKKIQKKLKSQKKKSLKKKGRRKEKFTEKKYIK